MDEAPRIPMTAIHRIEADGLRIFYREAGPADAPVVMLLHRFPDNVKLYPAFQEYFRRFKPPLLAIWGKNDLYFVPAGANAFRRDNPNATVQFVDTGHFALETHVEEIAAAMREFLAKTIG